MSDVLPLDKTKKLKHSVDIRAYVYMYIQGDDQLTILHTERSTIVTCTVGKCTVCTSKPLMYLVTPIKVPLLLQPGMPVTQRGPPLSPR
jgi:hypothetical protein